uniref:ABC-type xenobiotic transporter n=1 Tax=Fagus sylvatica TaxID=28930 RepID=A0A2N9HDR0_FAGSY
MVVWLWLTWDLGFGYVITYKHLNATGTFLPLQGWLVMLFQGFTWLLLDFTVIIDTQRLQKITTAKLCSIVVFLFAGFLCFSSLWFIIVEKMASVEMVLDILSFLGSVLLLLCVFGGHKNVQTDPDFSLDTSYAPLQGEEANAKGENNSNEDVTPFAKAGFLSIMSFSWLDPLMKLGKEKILEDIDIPQLREADRAQTCCLMFNEQLSKQRQKATNESPSIFFTFIEVADGNAAFEYEGYALAGGLFLAKCLESFSERQWFFRTRLVGLQVRSFLSAAIYQKQLRLSNDAKVNHSPGQILNYVTVDAYRIATVGALIAFILTVVATSPLAKFQHKYQTKLMVVQDKRLKAITEALANMKDPIRMIPDVAGAFIEAKVSITRIVKFLEAPELENGGTRKKCDGKGLDQSIFIRATEISWENNSANCHTKKHKFGGETWRKGCYLWSGWIRKIYPFSCNSWRGTKHQGHRSIRENILFGSSMDPLRYQEVLRRCSLMKDLEMLPFGVLTEIGERGVTLSGGQKQRVQLACALYQNADVYLLDDPFSAVDAQTATSLFNEYVMGALSRKTVLLVTHQVDFLPAFDSVLVVKNFKSLVKAHHDTVGSERQAEYASSVKSESSKSEIEKNHNEKQLMSSLGDQLIKQEERETGDTGLKPYIQYLKQDKGFLYFSLATICHLIFIVGQIIQNYWLAANIQDSHNNRRYYFASAKELMRTEGTTKSLIASHLSESIAGAMTIRAFGEEEQFFLKNLNLIDRNASQNFHSFSANEWLIQRLEILCAIVLSSSALGMTLLRLGASASERLEQYMHIPGEAAEVIESQRPLDNWPSFGEVKICDLKVRYRPNAPLVLQGISCIFEGGHKIGIVGRTGSGKTTLISALFRLVEPIEGMIIIDGIDISSLGLHDLRSRLGIIPQDPTLFSGSVRYNLDPLSKHTDQEIWEVLGKCQLREAIREKEEGLNSLVMQDGSNWSLGQRQLFCLGRALLKRSQILVLDEATASIDNATDSIIQKTIRTEFTSCTVITVAHRIPTVMDCTKVLAIKRWNIGLILQVEAFTRNIAREAYWMQQLGEKIPEQRIVRKVMRSLPERFRPKVIAIEESKDLDCVKIEELVGSLQTYELTLPHPKNKRFRKIFKPRKSDRKEIHHHKGYINNFTHSK